MLPTIAAVTPRMLLPVIARARQAESNRTVRREPREAAGGGGVAMLKTPVAGLDPATHGSLGNTQERL